MPDPTLIPEYVTRLAIGRAKRMVAEAEGKVRQNAEELAYWEGKLAEAKAYLQEVQATNPNK